MDWQDQLAERVKDLEARARDGASEITRERVAGLLKVLRAFERRVSRIALNSATSGAYRSKFYAPPLSGRDRD
jgi:hypothetical protein